MSRKRPPKAKVLSFDPFISLGQVVHGIARYVVVAYVANCDDDALATQIEDLGLKLSNSDGKEGEDAKEEEEGEKYVVFEVGQVGGLARWWSGKWTVEDVRAIAVTGGVDAQQNVVDAAAQNFCEGNLSVGGISAREALDKDIQTQSLTQSLTQTQTQTQTQSSAQSVPISGPHLSINPAGGGASHRISLTPLSAKDASERVANVLFATLSQISTQNHAPAQIFPRSSSSAREKNEEVAKLLLLVKEYAAKNEENLVQMREMHNKIDELQGKTAPKRPMSARTRGLPHKKPRTVQEQEFGESDDDEPKIKKAKK